MRITVYYLKDTNVFVADIGLNAKEATYLGGVGAPVKLITQSMGPSKASFSLTNYQDASCTLLKSGANIDAARFVQRLAEWPAACSIPRTSYHLPSEWDETASVLTTTKDWSGMSPRPRRASSTWRSMEDDERMEKVSHLIDVRGLSVAEASKMLGVSSTTITSWYRKPKTDKKSSKNSGGGGPGDRLHTQLSAVMAILDSNREWGLHIPSVGAVFYFNDLIGIEVVRSAITERKRVWTPAEVTSTPQMT